MKFARNFGTKTTNVPRHSTLFDFQQPTPTIMTKLVSNATVRCNAHAYIRVDDVSGTSVLVPTCVRKTAKSDY